MPGVEVRRLRCEKQQRAREVGRLAEPAFRNAREEALAHFPRTIAILEHPMRERRTKYGRSQRVDRDTGIAPLAAQRLGDAVDRPLRRNIRRATSGTPQQPARRRHQDPFPALALLEHLPTARARDKPTLL